MRNFRKVIAQKYFLLSNHRKLLFEALTKTNLRDTQPNLKQYNVNIAENITIK